MVSWVRLVVGSSLSEWSGSYIRSPGNPGQHLLPAFLLSSSPETCIAADQGERVVTSGTSSVL